MESTLSSLPYLAAAVMLFTGLAFVSDLRTRRIPNWLTVSSLALAVVFHLATRGWPGLLFAASGFGAGFGILLVLWLIGGGGGGDVKLMGALGAWLGPTTTLVVFVSSSLLAVAIWFAILAWKFIRSSGSTVPAADSGVSPNPVRRRTMLPYAVPVAIVTWCVMSLKLFAAFGH